MKNVKAAIETLEKASGDINFQLQFPHPGYLKTKLKNDKIQIREAINILKS